MASNATTARDLRYMVFHAWCLTKNESRKSAEQETRKVEETMQEKAFKEKEEKTAASTRAYKCWKEGKEFVITEEKKNAQNHAKNQMKKVAEESQSKREEADLVYKAWKKKKEKELKEQYRNENRITIRENANFIRKVQMKHEDAGAAFKAWKFKKLQEFQEMKQKVFVKDEEMELRKSLEKSQKDAESLEAYQLWLAYKEQQEDLETLTLLVDDRPPWNPPG